MDKRAAVRVPVRARAQFRADGLVIDGLVEDVSRNGLFMRSPRQIDPGASADLDLDLPGEETLHLKAEVVRDLRFNTTERSGFQSAARGVDAARFGLTSSTW